MIYQIKQENQLIQIRPVLSFKIHDHKSHYKPDVKLHSLYFYTTENAFILLIIALSPQDDDAQVAQPMKATTLTNS